MAAYVNPTPFTYLCVSEVEGEQAASTSLTHRTSRSEEAVQIKKTCLQGLVVAYRAHIQSHSLLLWSQHVAESIELKQHSRAACYTSQKEKNLREKLDHTRLLKGSLVASGTLNALLILGSMRAVVTMQDLAG